METKLLGEFITLAEFLNFTSAARALNISQSTLSRHVGELERDLGAELLTRSDRPALTPAGEALLEEADELLACEARMRRKVATATPPSAACIIKVEDYPYSKPLVNLVLGCVDVLKARGFDVSAEFVSTKGGHPIEECVMDGHFDVGVVVHLCEGEADFGRVPGVRYVPLPGLRSPLWAYLSSDDPALADADGGGIPLNALKERKFVLPLRPEWGNFRRDFDTICAGEGFEPKYALRRTHSMTDLGVLDMDGLVQVITEADVASPDSMFLVNPGRRAFPIKGSYAAVPALVFAEPPVNEALKVLADIAKASG